MSRLKWFPPLRLLAIFVVIHMATSQLFIIMVFGLGMKGFDTGDPTPPSFAIFEAVAEVLLSPVITSLESSPEAWNLFPGVFFYIPLMVNGLIWGFGCWLIAAAISRLRNREASVATARDP